jgi:hypothetical protein
MKMGMRSTFIYEENIFNKSKILTKIPQKILDNIKSNEVLDKI